MPTNTLDPMYGQYNLLPAPAVPYDEPDPLKYSPNPDKYVWPNGLVSLQSPAWMTIICGNHREIVQVTLEKLDEAPGDPSDEWETVVDISMFNPTGELQVLDWDGRPVENLRIDVPPSDDWVRVRVQATRVGSTPSIRRSGTSSRSGLHPKLRRSFTGWTSTDSNAPRPRPRVHLLPAASTGRRFGCPFHAFTPRSITERTVCRFLADPDRLPRPGQRPHRHMPVMNFPTTHAPFLAGAWWRRGRSSAVSEHGRVEVVERFAGCTERCHVQL